MSALVEAVAPATRVVSLTDAVELNPRPDRAALSDDLEVSFVPMAAVEAGSGRMDATAVRRFGEVKKGYTVFREGDVLFAKITPCMENGKMAVARGLHNGVGCGSTEFHVLRARPSVDPHYVYHFVSSARFRAEAAHQMTGAVGQKRVPAAFLEQSEIPLPDLYEQRRIVAEIEKQFSRLDEAVANLKRVKANLKRYKAAVLKAAVEGRLVPTEAEIASREGRGYETGAELLRQILGTRKSEWIGRSRYKEPVRPDVADLHQLPEGWSWCAADQVFEKITDGEHISPTLVPNGIPLLSAKDVIEAGVTFEDAKYVTHADAAKFRSRCDPCLEDILIVSRGATIGRTCQVNVKREFCVMGSVILMKPHRSVSPRFLLAALRAGFFLTRLTGVSGSTAQQAIYLRDVRPLQLPLPPLAEQRRIVAEVDRQLSFVRELEVEIETNQARARSLREASLTSAFSSSRAVAETLEGYAQS